MIKIGPDKMDPFPHSVGSCPVCGGCSFTRDCFLCRGNSLWSQTSNCSLFNGVACCILRWSIFIVCLIVYCFCLVILVNVYYTHYNSFYFWEGWIYLRVSYVKFWMMIFSMDIVWSKYIIFMHIFPRKWSSKNYDSVPHSQGLMNEVSEHFYHTVVTYFKFKGW